MSDTLVEMNETTEITTELNPFAALGINDKIVDNLTRNVITDRKSVV